jgi:hypothetical protein
MRNEFYGDRKDLWKWTVVLNEAGEDREILYVAMCRPDRKVKRESGIRADVIEFFHDEYNALTPRRNFPGSEACLLELFLSWSVMNLSGWMPTLLR